MVAQEIVNGFKSEKYGKDDIMDTYWALIVKKDEYKFDQSVKDIAGTYYEYALSSKYLCIMARKW